MSLETLLPEIFSIVVDNLEDLNELRAVALTSRRLLNACLGISSLALTSIFARSYADPMPLLLAAVKAEQLQHWIYEPSMYADAPCSWTPACEERLVRIRNACNSFSNLRQEALTILPLSFNDLKKVRKFALVGLPWATDFMFMEIERHVAPDFVDHGQTKLLVLAHETYYQLFRCTFGTSLSQSWPQCRRRYVKHCVPVFSDPKLASIWAPAANMLLLSLWSWMHVIDPQNLSLFPSFDHNLYPELDIQNAPVGVLQCTVSRLKFGNQGLVPTIEHRDSGGVNASLVKLGYHDLSVDLQISAYLDEDE
ncbi:hypothetical protein MMC13_004904 [Lambiella insularis]|nr:hypothetical protein [Lambiella insularis]